MSNDLVLLEEKIHQLPPNLIVEVDSFVNELELEQADPADRITTATTMYYSKATNKVVILFYITY